MDALRSFFQRIADQQAVAAELARSAAHLEIATGHKAAAALLLVTAQRTAHRLAQSSPHSYDELLPVVVDQIMRRIAQGLPLTYIIERMDALQDVDDLRNAALPFLLPHGAN